MNKNEFNQPIGHTLKKWQPAKTPQKTNILGTHITLEPLHPDKHGPTLFDLFHIDNSIWTYLPYGPFDTYDEFYAWLISMAKVNDPFPYAILSNKTKTPIGIATFLRITPEHSAIEVGHLLFSKDLKKTPAATEAMYLMMHHAFEELGYRRYEWKCDSFNQPSRNAAERLGFKFEGTFRNHMVYKNRSRDTFWFSITDSEWPALKLRLQKWLNPNNFDTHGNQKSSLREMDDQALESATL